MEDLKKYNNKVAEKWNDNATKNNSELFLALAVNENSEVFAFWDNSRGNEEMIKHLRGLLDVLEKNKNQNFGGN